MKNMRNGFSGDEEIVFAMRGLYHSYGYTQYKMSRFESYDLYSQNRNFLKDDGIITVNDYGGKLMALKPDVTLSIVKNAAAGNFSCEKVYYDESVYRRAKGSKDIREMTQVGLECIGEIDLYSTAEVVMLALESLKIISSDYILDVSHMGFVSGLLDACGLCGESRSHALEAIGRKNIHGLRDCLDSENVSSDFSERLTSLVSLDGYIADVLPELKKLCCDEATECAYDELNELYNVLHACGMDCGVRLDFSVVNDMDYYNGLMFQGFVSGIPDTVLSGGRYDNLLHRFGCKAGAAGFAVYIDLLKQLTKDPEYDVDIILSYDEDIDPKDVASAVRQLRDEWGSVRVQNQPSGKITCRKKLKLGIGGLEEIEKND